jgi:hypothetical protein
MQTE